MILTECKPGNYKVTNLNGGKQFHHKMRVMGIYKDKEIRLVVNIKYYPVLIEFIGTTLSIGRGMASKIDVI